MLKKIVLMLVAMAGIACGQVLTPPPVPPAAAPPVVVPVFDKAIIDTAMKEVGVTKQEGYESDRVRQYVEETDQQPNEYFQDGWCNGFVSWVLKQTGYEFASLNSMDEINHFFRQVDVPKVGDVVIIPGHIAFYAGEVNFPGLDHAILLLGGNQGHRVCILPLSKSYVLEYLEPIKAPDGWMPSHHLTPLGLAAFNLLDDKSYAVDILERNERLVVP